METFLNSMSVISGVVQRLANLQKAIFFKALIPPILGHDDDDDDDDVTGITDYSP